MEGPRRGGKRDEDADGDAKGVSVEETAFELAPTGLAVVGVDECLRRVNRRLARMLRVDASVPVGLPFVDLVHPDDRGRAELRLDDLAVHTMHDRGRVRFLRPDDSVVWGGVGITRVAGADGAGAVVHVADLSDLVQAEERLGLVVGGLDDGVVVFDPSGGLVSANPAALRLLGNMVGRGWGDGTRDVDITLLDETGATIPLDCRADVLARTTGEWAESSGAVVDSDGEVRWLEIAAHPLERSHHERWVVATYKDVSEHRRVEAALRARRSKPIGPRRNSSGA